MNQHVLTRATKSLRIRPKSEKLEITLLLLGSLIFVSIKEAATCTPSSQVLLWADEFNEFDSGSWRFQYGDGSAYTLSSGWGNNELECYTGQPSNAAIITDPANKSNNLLSITAVHQNGYVCSNLQAASTVRNWTSAKLTTQGQKSFTSPSGKADGGAAAAAMDGSILIQARIKVPVINGFWPSFLMLPEPNPLGGWCASGAIDIMTHVGASTQVGCGLQYGGVSGGDGGACVYESGYQNLAANISDWQTYSLLWSPTQMTFAVNNDVYYVSNSSSWWSGSVGVQGANTDGAPFNSGWPFFLVLNLAVGGNIAGSNITGNKAGMLVDWIRVYNILPEQAPSSSSTTVNNTKPTSPILPEVTSSSPPQQYNTTTPAWAGGSLLWAEEFSSVDINRSVWSFQQGDGSSYGLTNWGTGEIECNTDSLDNAAIITDPQDSSNGLLSITALPQPPGYMCSNLQAPASLRTWTSARLSTQGRKSFYWGTASGGGNNSSSSVNGTASSGSGGGQGGNSRYNTSNGTVVPAAILIEARIKIPLAMGLWPAFWMLPEPNNLGGWCSSGEIDIMEHINGGGNMHSYLHYGGIKGGGSSASCKTAGGLKNIKASAGNWNILSIVWSSTYIAFQINGTEWSRVNSSSWWSGSARSEIGAPFDRPFYILLSLSVGGWPGNTISNGSHVMLVDWIRVWKLGTDMLPAPYL